MTYQGQIYGNIITYKDVFGGRGLFKKVFFPQNPNYKDLYF